MLKRESRLQFSLLRKIGFMRFFRRVKASDKKAFPLVGDLSRKALPFNLNAKKPASVVRPWLFDIANVFLVGDGSKIANPVIVADAVDVVKEMRRHGAVNVEPCQSVGFVGPVINVDVDVSIHVLVSGDTSGERHSPALQPSKHARFRVVAQQLFQSSLRQCISGFSHVIAPFQRWIGQGLEGVGSALLPRSIIGGSV